MKRSEMIKKIAKDISDYGGIHSEPTRNDMYMAGIILNTLEHNGMLPPEYYDIKLDRGIPGLDDGYLHEWEPED